MASLHTKRKTHPQTLQLGQVRELSTDCALALQVMGGRPGVVHPLEVHRGCRGWICFTAMTNVSLIIH